MKKGRKRRVLAGVLLLLAGLAVPGDLRSMKLQSVRASGPQPNHQIVPASLGNASHAAPRREILLETMTPPNDSAPAIVVTPRAVPSAQRPATADSSSGWWDPFASFMGPLADDEDLGDDLEPVPGFDGSAGVALSSGGASAPRTFFGSGGGSSGRPSGGGGGGLPAITTDTSGTPRNPDSSGNPTSGGQNNNDPGDPGDQSNPCSAPVLSNDPETLITFGTEQTSFDVRAVFNGGTIELAAGANLNISQFCSSPAWALHNTESGVFTLGTGAHASIAGDIVNHGAITLPGNDALIAIAPGGLSGEQRTITNEACALVQIQSPLGRSTLRCVGVDLVNRGALSGNGTIVFQGEASFDDQSSGSCQAHDLRNLRLRFDRAEKNDHSPAAMEIGCKDVGNARRGLDSVFSVGSLDVINSTLALVSKNSNESTADNEVLYVRTLTVAGGLLDLNGHTLYYKVEGPDGIDPQRVVLNGGRLIKLAGCPADFNGDDTVNRRDYLDFVEAFQLGLPSADFDHDGAIDLFDYDAFVVALETPC